MTREEILAAAGYPNTPDGIAAFYNEYDTPEKFFAKHGGIPKAQTGKSKVPSEKSWGEMTPKERAAYLDKKEALQKQNKKADAWAKKAEAKSREQAKKEYYKDWVAENYDKGAMNPMFQTVAGFTPMGVIPFAMQSGVSALNNLGQGNYLEAGIDAAFATPLLRGLKGTKKVVPKVKHKVGQMEGLGTSQDAVIPTSKRYGPISTMVFEGKYPAQSPTGNIKGDLFDLRNTGYTDVPSFNKQLNQMMTTAQFGKRPLETKIGPTNFQKALIRPEDLEYIGNDIPLIQYGQYMDTDFMPGKVKPYTGYQALQTLQPNKYGGLSGAPHNGQPTADQFFDYGSHANDKLNIPMSNPFYLEEGGAYYGGPTRPYKKGGLTKYQKKGEVVNPWQIPGATNPDNPNFIHSTTPGTTRWLTKEGKTPFQELLSKPKTYGSGEWTAQDTLIQNDPRLFNIEKTLEAKPEYKQAYWGSPIMRDLDEAERAEAYMLTYGDLRSLINQTGTAKGSNPDPYDQMYYNAIQGNESGNAKPVSSDLEKKLRFYSKAKKYGGDITEYCWGGGLPGGPNEMPEMLHGGYHSPMNYGSFPATEWGGALDPSNKDAFPMMEEGGLKQFLKSVSKAKKKAYKEGGKTTIQGGNQNFLENRRAAFDDALKNNVYNAFIQEEEKAAMQAMNPYASYMPEEDGEDYQARYGLSIYQKKGEKQPTDKLQQMPWGEFMAKVFSPNKYYSRKHLAGMVNSRYTPEDMELYEKNLRDLLSNKFTPEKWSEEAQYGPLARMLGKTGRKMFGPKRLTYTVEGMHSKQVPIKDTDLYLKDFEKQRQLNRTPLSYINNYNDDFNREPTEYTDRAINILPQVTRQNKSDEYIQLDPVSGGNDFEQFYPYEYGGALNTYQGGGLTQEQYDELIRLYNAAEQASKTSKKNQATFDFQRAFHNNPETRKIAEQLLQQRQAANNPTAYGRTLGAGNEYSLTSNEDRYFGDTTKQYLAGLQTLKPQSSTSYLKPGQTQMADMDVPDTNISDLSFNKPVSTTPNLASSAATNPVKINNLAGDKPKMGNETTLDTGLSDAAKSKAIVDKAKGFPYRPLEKVLDFDGKGKDKLDDLTETETTPGSYKFDYKRKTNWKGLLKNSAIAADFLAGQFEDKPEPSTSYEGYAIRGNRGDYDFNSGEFRPHLKVPVQFGEEGPASNRVGKYGGALPQALSGLEIKMQPGLYGTNGNRQFSLPTQIDSQKYAQQPTEVRNSLTAVPRDQANLEAEGGETALVNIDGIPAHFKISGKRHSQGGVPLDLPDNSFIYSDTASMKIKDPNILAQFGMAPKKGGYTPAEIAKKYDINKYRKILSDPNSEALERKTAEAMIANCNMKLAKLALIQESMKGFPQGIPVVAMPYIMTNNIDPSMYIPTQGQEEQPDEDMGVSRYGGNIVAQYPTMRYGGLPKAQNGKNKVPKLSYDELADRSSRILDKIRAIKNEWYISDDDEETLKQLIDQYNQYDALITELYGNTPAQHEQFSDRAKAIKAAKARTKNLGIEGDSEWVSSSGDRFDEEGNLKQEYGYFDPNAIGEYFGKIGKRFSGDITQFAPPPESGMGVVENPGSKKVRQFVSKLNPANAEDPLDYVANIVNFPLYGVNNLLTGQWESTGNIYTDVPFDPTTWFGVKPYIAPFQGAKYAGKLVMQYGPEVGRFLQKYGARGLEIIQRYGAAGIDAIKKYGSKGIDYVVKGVKYIAEKAPIVAKKIAENTPPGGVVNLISRGLQGYAQEKEKDKEIGKLQIKNKILEDALMQSEQASADTTKVKEPTKISPKAELAKKNTVANMQRAEAEYLNTIGALNRFVDFKQPRSYQQFASALPQYERPVLAPSAPVVVPPALVKNVEVKKKPAAKTSNIDWENVDWSKYEVKKK